MENVQSEFDGIVTRYASDIRSGKCSDYDLKKILEEIGKIPRIEYDKYEPHISRIKTAISKVETMIASDKKGRKYSRPYWGWLMTPEETNIVAFSLEWRIHERINGTYGYTY